MVRKKKAKKLQDRISFKTVGGKRVTGVVKGIRKEYYIVYRKGKMYKVDRNSAYEAFGKGMNQFAGFIGKKIKQRQAKVRARDYQWHVHIVGITGRPTKFEVYAPNDKKKAERAALREYYKMEKSKKIGKVTRLFVKRGKRVYLSKDED